MYLHLIFATKGWEPIITPKLLALIVDRIQRNLERKGAELIAANGQQEHVHFLVKLKKEIPLSSVIGWSKGECSHWINAQHPDLHFYWQKGFWHEQIAGEYMEKVQLYIKNQDSIHGEMSFSEEITRFRKGHSDWEK